MPVVVVWDEVLKEKVDVGVIGTKKSVREWSEGALETKGESVKVLVAPFQGCGRGHQVNTPAEAHYHANIYCMKHLTADGKPCPVRWEAHPEAESMVLGRRAHMDTASGQKTLVPHASHLRTLWGQSFDQRAKARASGDKTPLRTMAGMCEEAQDAAEAAAIPAIEALRGQRKRFLQAERAGDVKVSDSVILWKQFVGEIAFDMARWERAGLFTFFSVRVEKEGAPPIALLVSKACLHYVRCWVKTRKQGSICVDSCFGLNVSDWPLASIGGMAQHYDATSHMRRAMGLPFSMNFGPKEDVSVQTLALECTFAFFEKQ